MEKNETKTIKVELGKFADVFARMIRDEINNQEQWDKEENFINHKTRLAIIEELEKWQNQLTEQGIPPFWYYK